MRQIFSIMIIVLLLSGSLAFFGSIQEQRMGGHNEIIAVADSGVTFSQASTPLVQTTLSLLVVYNELGCLGLGANLTATDGSPVTGATITFYLQQVTNHPATDGWFPLGSSATNDAGVATLGIGLYGFYGHYRIKASHEQDVNFSGAESIVDIVFPSDQAVHIKSDGSIYPPNAAIRKSGDLYTLTGDIVGGYGGISIERDNIVLDGDGHMIKPPPHIIGAYGIGLVDRTNVTVENIHIESFFVSIKLSNCTNSTVTKNRLTKSEYADTILKDTGATVTLGFFIDASANNSISENEVNSIELGGFVDSSGNTICHNNFINHWSSQVSIGNSENTWDGGYPCGGNYWSDYSGTDSYGGPSQNIPGSDGIGDTHYIIDANNTDRYPLITPYGKGHDVAVTNLAYSKNVAGQGYSSNVSATVANLGSFNETFNVTVYANATIIGSQNVTLSAGNSTVVTFIWNTTGFAYGNYILRGYAWPVPGETYTANNNLTGGVVTVTIPGDLNGDFDVSLADLIIVAIAFGSTPSSPNWNPNTDLAAPWGVIGLSDIVTLAMHYGQHYP